MPENLSEIPWRIAAVDDHPIILSALRVLLENEPGFVFAGQAATVESAVKLVCQARPHAVVLDLWLGGNDGIEMIKQLHALAPEVALLCYTMTDEAHFGLKVLAAGARGFISKQEPLEEVANALRMICAGNRYLSKRLTRLAFDNLVASGSLAAGLTDRELQVLRLIGLAKSNQQIADDLSVSVKTVSAHRENLKRKLGLRNGTELGRHAVLMVESRVFGQNLPRDS